MKATGLARLGNDAEIRYTTNGDAVANLRLAFAYGKKGADGRKPVQWVDSSLWGKRAEALAPYLKKGTQLVAHLEDVRIEKYQGQNGEGYKMVGKMTDLELVGRSESSQANHSADDYRAAKEGRSAPKADFSDLDEDPPF